MDLAARMEISAQDKANRKGESFSFEEFNSMLTQEYREIPKVHDEFMHFSEYLSYMFVAFTFLLGALRSTQFKRLNSAGKRAQNLEWGNHDKGYWRPLVTIKYAKPKTRNASGPTAPNQVVFCTIVCTCKGHHEPLMVQYKQDGNTHVVMGNAHCWFNLFWHVRDMQIHDGPLMRVWNCRARSFGNSQWGADRIRTAIATWCAYCGVTRQGANNTWCRKTYRTSTGIMSYRYLRTQVLLITTGLRDMQLPTPAVMAVTGHRSEAQMRRDYCTNLT